MKVQTKYRVHQHHKFEHGGRKYAADLESNITVEINEIEWALLNRDLTETIYETVEGLKSQFEIDQIFEGIERLQRLSRRRHLLSPTEVTRTSPQSEERLKLLVPIQFVQEQSALDAVTNENRYHLLAALSKHAELETLNTTGRSSVEFGEFVSIRNLETKGEHSFPLPWYAMDGYDGILLLSQFLWHDILYYPQNVPVFRCLESDRKLGDTALSETLEHYAAQKSTDLLLPKASWLTDWLSDFGVAPVGMHTIGEGINVVESIGRPLAKQHTAVLTENPRFARQPVVGVISGFKPNTGVSVISKLAAANPYLAFFVYDSILAKEYRDPPSNVVIFSAEEEETRAVLPIFFQALDLVCFPAVTGTSPSLVLEAMAYGTPAVVISQYGLPPEIKGAGVLVQCPAGRGNELDIPMQHLSETINQLLTDTERHEKYEQIAKGFAARYTWEGIAQEIVRLFKQSSAPANAHCQSSAPLSGQPLFCRYYDPRTNTTYSSAYREETKQFERLENALAEVLSKSHTPTEVETVFKHFRRHEGLHTGNGHNLKG
ncbi:MAG: glycosyltransferase [Candidatus Poribacteria bacterium]|nr:glycosyltransferase [Candidatus Poribacteria bacterium]